MKNRKVKTTYSLLLFVLFTSISFAQEKYKMAEGFYNMSAFEVSSGMYLLETKEFYTYASFGNVDLELFGEYKISDDDILTFETNKDLLENLYVYGLNEKSQSKNLRLTYQRPYDQNAEKLFVVVDEKKIDFPAFNENDSTSLTLKMPKSTTIEIGYKNPETHKIISTEKVLLEGINDLRIFHNYYAEMTLAFSQVSSKLENGILTQEDEYETKAFKKAEMTEEDKEEMRNYLQDVKNNNFIVRDEKVYQRL